MDSLILVVGYGAAWWLAWSAAVLVQRREHRPHWRQHLMGLWHGLWFSSVVGWLLAPPAAWWGYACYVPAGLMLLGAWAEQDNLRAGRRLFDDGKPGEAPTAAAASSGTPAVTLVPGPLLAAPVQSAANTVLLDAAPVAPLPDSGRVLVVPAACEPPLADATPDELPQLRELCRALTADGSLDEEEIHDLKRWLDAHPGAIGDGVERMLVEHMAEVLADDAISVLEAFDLFDLAEAVALGKSRHEMAGWEPLAPLLDDVPDTPARRPAPRRKGRSRSRRLEGSKLDTIRFAYRNANGEYSERRVVVRVVDDEYFEGRCLTRQAMRTFRLDRIIGEVTSEQTGEVLDPYAWALALGDVAAAPRAVPAVAASQVLFTGFRKAEREELERSAEAAGMVVRKSMSKTLDYLVAGPNAGPSKLAQAAELGVVVLSAEAFAAQLAMV